MALLLNFRNENADAPDFAGLRLESKHWMDLQEYASAEAALEVMRTAFGGSSDAEVVKGHEQVRPPPTSRTRCSSRRRSPRGTRSCSR